MWKNREECCIIEMRYTAHRAPVSFNTRKRGRMGVSMSKKTENDELIQRACAFCEFGTPIRLSAEEEPDIICEKHGIVKADHICRSFCYDLLKREPKEKRPFPKLSVISLDD